MNIENLRYRGLPVFREGGRLFVVGLVSEREWLIDVGANGRWWAYADTSPHGDCQSWDGHAADQSTGMALAVQCLIDNGVLTVIDNGVLTVIDDAPAAAPMKFIRLPAPLPWKANEILRTADVNAIYGAEVTFTADMPAAKADAIVALLSALNIHAKSYEV